MQILRAEPHPIWGADLYHGAPGRAITWRSNWHYGWRLYVWGIPTPVCRAPHSGGVALYWGRLRLDCDARDVQSRRLLSVRSL
jgi:hypothetical protein